MERAREHFLNSSIIGFGTGACCITKIGFSHAIFHVSFQSSKPFDKQRVPAS